jgi:hypothetical protein
MQEDVIYIFLHLHIPMRVIVHFHNSIHIFCPLTLGVFSTVRD